jgi:hypothetical protein
MHSISVFPAKRTLAEMFFYRYFHLIVNLLSMTGVILNDETVHQLCKQAVSQVYFIESAF